MSMNLICVTNSPMNRTILQIESDDAFTFAVLHQQIHSKIFDEVVTIIAQRLTIQSVQQGMTGSVCMSKKKCC